METPDRSRDFGTVRTEQKFDFCTLKIMSIPIRPTQQLEHPKPISDHQKTQAQSFREKRKESAELHSTPVLNNPLFFQLFLPDQTQVSTSGKLAITAGSLP